MKAIFTFTPKKGYNLRDVMFDLIEDSDFLRYLQEMSETQLTMEIKPTSKRSEKELMYAYYHKVVLGAAMEAFSNDGWESMDKVKADYMLKAELAKDVMYNAKEDKEEYFLEDKSKMSKKRLGKFINDCILFLEIEKGVNVPESDEYKHFNSSGMMGFKTINNNKDNF